MSAYYSAQAPSIQESANVALLDSLKDSIADTAAFSANGYDISSSSSSSSTTTTSFYQENQLNNNMGYQDMLDDVTRISQLVGQFFYMPINMVDEMMKRFIRRFLTVTNSERVDGPTNSHRVQPLKK